MKKRITLTGISLLLSSTLIGFGQEPAVIIELGFMGGAVLLFLALSALMGKKPASKK